MMRQILGDAMPDLHIYLYSPLRENAEKGEVNLFNRIAAAVAPAGYAPVYHGDTLAERARAAVVPGLHLVIMQEPIGPRCLSLRRAYTYPFWQIEATQERWHFDVAHTAFDPETVDDAAARPFFRRWREKFLGDGAVSKDGFIFMPLQGRIRDHRSFQSMSPLAMIEATLDADPKRPIIATLHPKEIYDSADHAALEALTRRFSRFSIVQAEAKALVRTCDYIATQNSAVALTGFFAKKPAVLFAGIDFHHIAGSVERDGLDAAFADVSLPRAYAKYLYWFFKEHTINAGAPEAEAQILARMRRHGWPV